MKTREFLVTIIDNDERCIDIDALRSAIGNYAVYAEEVRVEQIETSANSFVRIP